VAPDFAWDAHNVAHIARHDVSVDEAQGAMHDPDLLPQRSYLRNNERRIEVIGSTYGGRLLDIVFTWRDGKVRVVTARDAKRKERRSYRSLNG
jgi:uncharacterized DUF497 family protein